jgi:hypothetical protein
MRISLPLTALTLLAACGQPAATNDNAAVTSNQGAGATAEAPAATEAVPTPAPTGTTVPTPAPSPTPTPSPSTPVAEGPIEAGSAQDAANVVQTYFALLEAGKYGQAYRLWQPAAVGMNRAAFARSFAKYAEYHAEVGAPGRVDAGAGQRYVTVPAQVYGRLKSGGPFRMRGDVTLHRTGDIDGASAAQRRWRIRDTILKPRS